MGFALGEDACLREQGESDCDVDDQPEDVHEDVAASGDVDCFEPFVGGLA